MSRIRSMIGLLLHGSARMNELAQRIDQATQRVGATQNALAQLDGQLAEISGGEQSFSRRVVNRICRDRDALTELKAAMSRCPVVWGDPERLCIAETAEMDSCSQARMLFHIYLPLSKPMIATISLFSALGYWNDWINGLYYISVKRDLYTIQNVLNAMQSSIQFLKENASAAMTEFAMNLPSMGVRMAIAVVAVVPIMVIYPFFQKSFVRGIVIGGVKG